ncbi:hypothetical protein [Pyrobaculum aerophilum]|uniref:hypothetical protein n=1 Tax=Pyrobaculum aerophilum TaxID=13773 RepID=UPI0011C072BF|nr:hypothetical protein [Pyrobaculum aerophilum]
MAVPRDAFGKKPPRGFRGGVLRVYVNNTWVDLLEAPPGIVATYSYIDNVNKSEIKPFKGRAQWVERPKGRGPDKRPPRQAADEVGSSSEVAVEQVSSTQLATVYADGGFFYASLKNVYLYANVERCLPVLRVDDPTFSPTMYPTIAVLGYNATYMWRVYAAVYTSATGWLRPVGKMVVRVYEVHPELQSVGNKLGEWSFDVYNFLPSFSTGIPLSWPNRFVGLEICFRPSVSGVYYIVGANATVEFRKNSISYAGGNYVLGYSGTPISRFRFNKDTVLLGPVTLSDGFVNQRISISLGAGVVVNTPNCPTLTMDVYLGQNAQYWVGGCQSQPRTIAMPLDWDMYAITTFNTRHPPRL